MDWKSIWKRNLNPMFSTTFVKNMFVFAHCIIMSRVLTVPDENRKQSWKTIVRWGFFSVPHLLWHGACIYNGNPRGPVTLAVFAERLTKELLLLYLFLRLTRSSLLGFEQTNFQMRDKRSNRQHHRRGRREHSVW